MREAFRIDENGQRVSGYIRERQPASVKKISSRLSLLTGVVISLLLVLPGFRPGSLPVAYIGVIGVFLIVVWKGLRLPTTGRTSLAIWLLPVIWVLLHTSIFNSSNLLILSARNGMALLGALLILSLVRSQVDYLWFLVGMSPVLLLDGIVGIGQFFQIPLAIQIPEMLVTSDLTWNAFEKQTSTPRIWGVQTHAHVFAYSQAIWALLTFWSLLTLKMRPSLRLLLIVVVTVASLSVLLTAQRSMIWSLFPAMLIIYGFTRGFSRAIILTTFMIFAVSTLDVYQWLSEKNSVIDRIITFNSENTERTDTVRFRTWIYAASIIAEDPLLGTAYDSDEIDIYLGHAIHNGILNGWVQFGLPWVFFFCIAVGITCRGIWRSRVALSHRIAALAIFGLTLANTMVQPQTPGGNDMTFLIALGIILAFLNAHRRRVRRVVSEQTVRPTMGSGQPLLISQPRS